MIELPPVEPEPEKASKPAARRAGPATQWKQSAARPPSSRGALLALATLLFCAVAGVAVGLFLFLGAPKPPYFVTLPVEGYGRNYPAAVCAEADAEWLLKVFEAERRENATNMVREGGTFRKKLAVLAEGSLLPDGVGTTKRQLEPDRALVIHVVCHAAARDGKVYLLPGDAAGDAAGWVPLDDLLDAVKECPARDKCLLLDVGRPRTRTFAGPYADDASAALHAHLKARRDGGLLPYPVIASCGERERSHVVGVAGVSAFAYYAAEGLRGAADGATPGEKRDACVTVRELDTFLKLRVGRWVKRNRDAAQSPVLYAADGQDFKLTYSAHPTPPATTEEADDKPLDPGDPYRDAVARWKPAAATPRPAAADDIPGRSILAVPVPAAPPVAPGTPPPPDPGAAVASAYDKLWRAKSAAKPGDTAAEQGKYDEAAGALPPEFVGRTLWVWMLDTHPAPKTGLLQMLQATLLKLKCGDFRESATLDFVLAADIANSTGQGEAVAGKLFAVEREFAELFKSGEAEFGWVQSRAADLVARQRAVERRLKAGGVVPLAEFDALRAGVADATAALRAVQEARAALAFAVNRLAGTALAVAEFGRPGEKPWNACLDAAIRLADQIDREPTADGKAGDWQQLTAALAEAVKPLVTPYEAAAVKALVDGGPKAGPAELRAMEATRATPFLGAKDREALNLAIAEAEKRLHAATRKDDLQENATGAFPSAERPPEGAAHDAPRARSEVSARLHALAGLGTVPAAAVAGAWAKERRALAAELLKKGDVPKLERLASVEPFGTDAKSDFADALREARAARRELDHEAYRAWRATCSR